MLPPIIAFSTCSPCKAAGLKAWEDDFLDMEPSYFSHVLPIDQVLWVGKSTAKDGGETASSEGVSLPGVVEAMPGAGGVLLLLCWPGLAVGEVDLIMLRGAVLDRALR